MKTIEIVSIPVVDQQRSKEFYTKLGFQVLTEAPMGDGNTWVQMGLPNQVTSITLISWEKSYPAGCLKGLLLETEDIEKEVQELQAKGIEVGKVNDTPWGKFASLKDPDGNGLDLHQK